MPHDDPGLVDDDFWGMPLHRAPELLDALLDERLDGASDLTLRLWAPRFVALDARATLPVFVGAACPANALASLSLEDRAVVVAFDLDASGERPLARVTRGADGPARRLPPMPGFEGGLGPASSSRGAEVTPVDLWRGSGTKWPSGRYLLAAIAGDRASSPVPVHVGRAASTVDPAVRDQLERSPRAVWPPPDPAGGLPRYHASELSPAVPDAPGIALRVDRVVVAPDGGAQTAASRARCVVDGAFRARMRKGVLSPRGAAVSALLVLTGSEDPSPIVLALHLPSFDRIDPASPPDTITGHFSIDLFALAPIARAPQTYFVYALFADGAAGPLPLAVVAESGLAAGARSDARS